MPPEALTGSAVRFAYYLIHIRTEKLLGSLRASGVLEDLGTSERVPFSSLEDLMGILSRAGQGPDARTPLTNQARDRADAELPALPAIRIPSL